MRCLPRGLEAQSNLGAGGALFSLASKYDLDVPLILYGALERPGYIR